MSIGVQATHSSDVDVVDVAVVLDLGTKRTRRRRTVRWYSQSR